MGLLDLADMVVGSGFAVFGDPASYTAPGSNDPIGCTVVLDKRDEGASQEDGRPLVGQVTIKVMSSEVPQPAMGGVFEIAGLQYTVVNRPQHADASGSIWKMWAE